MLVEALVLWDVDKTLVDVSGVSRDIYAVTFEKVTGRPLDKLAEMTGRTEHAILVDILTLNGVSETRFDAFYDALGLAAHDLRDRMREVGRALSGAGDAIRALQREGVVQSVATGNLRSIAETKLEAFDLTAGLDFDVGGYGDDDGVRAELVRLVRVLVGLRRVGCCERRRCRTDVGWSATAGVGMTVVARGHPRIGGHRAIRHRNVHTRHRRVPNDDPRRA